MGICVFLCQDGCRVSCVFLLHFVFVMSRVTLVVRDTESKPKISVTLLS